MIRALIADDEKPARDRLWRLLDCIKDVQVVGEAEDGEGTIEKTLELRPDLVLLDIEMPGCKGTEVVSSLPLPRPQVIFCTAFEQYAVDAFDLGVIDYLMKPVSRLRLDQALNRVRQSSPESLGPQARSAACPFPTRFFARRAGKFHVVPALDVLYFTSEHGLTNLCTRDQQYWVDPTLADLEKRLDPAAFYRISRAVIVNLNTIREILPLTNGSAQVLFNNDVRLQVSRRRARKLIKILKGFRI